MERPIILKAHEVRGILDGRQTQLRRIIKSQPVGKEVFQRTNRLGRKVWTSGYNGSEGLRVAFGQFDCPLGQVGDRLWVRETCWYDPAEDVIYAGSKPLYRADGELQFEKGHSWTPATRMPRWASRILLEIVSVRVERLQDIVLADVYAHAFQRCTKDGDLFKWGREEWPWTEWCLSLEEAYCRYAKEMFGAGGWNANPWLWVVELKRVDAV